MLRCITVARCGPQSESFGGPFFVIVWISFILYGLGLAQVYFYLTTYRDHYAMRLVVILLCVLETMQVGTCIHFLYADLVADFSNPENLLTVLWSEIAAMSLELIINGLVQSYYIYRIWRLSHNIPMVVYLSVVLGCRTATGFRASSFAYPYNDWLVLGVLKPYKRFAAATLSLSVLLDSSITFILWLYLRHAHSLACKRSTRNTVHKLMYYALSAGGLTTMASVVTLCVFIMAASPVLFGGLAMIMAKLYANSMLAM
ncbi:hypothetical protein BC629DRAFT_75543 [Irpex lacteus]|nr:hypothetical protein BC629DRAFT_75543 [Irpex lacteus]